MEAGGVVSQENKMKMFSFCSHGVGYLFRLITRSIFCAFNRVLRLDKSESVYQDCEGNDTTGMPFFCICERNTVIQRVLLVHAFKLCKSTEMVSVFFGSSYFAVRDGNGSSYEKK